MLNLVAAFYEKLTQMMLTIKYLLYTVFLLRQRGNLVPGRY